MREDLGFFADRFGVQLLIIYFNSPLTVIFFKFPKIHRYAQLFFFSYTQYRGEKISTDLWERALQTKWRQILIE